MRIIVVIWWSTADGAKGVDIVFPNGPTLTLSIEQARALKEQLGALNFDQQGRD